MRASRGLKCTSEEGLLLIPLWNYYKCDIITLFAIPPCITKLKRRQTKTTEIKTIFSHQTPSSYLILLFIIWQTQSQANPCALIGSFSVRILQYGQTCPKSSFYAPLRATQSRFRPTELRKKRTFEKVYSTDCFHGNGPICVFLFRSNAGKFKICNQNSEKRKCEYCHSSH